MGLLEGIERLHLRRDLIHDSCVNGGTEMNLGGQREPHLAIEPHHRLS